VLVIDKRVQTTNKQINFSCNLLNDATFCFVVIVVVVVSGGSGGCGDGKSKICSMKKGKKIEMKNNICI
jgi:hypothetical protein